MTRSSQPDRTLRRRSITVACALGASSFVAMGCHVPAKAPLPSTSVAPAAPSASAMVSSVPPQQPTIESKPICPTLTPAPTISNGTSCGPLDCRIFDQAADALAFVLRETSPLVLAVGEIHAQKGSALKASPTQRFASLLPMFCGSAQHIVIELWTRRNDCGDKRVAKVEQAQKPITQAQAATNQNDFYELGNVAKANRIQPHALTPTCDDYQSILAAKDQDVARMLELTATRTADLTEELLKRKGDADTYPKVILYGGAMHNDVIPSVGREGFSYGPRLAASTQNRLTELDIVLREQVKDTESYQRLAWYPHFRSETLEKQLVLYRLGPRSFTLIYPNQSQLP